MAIRWYSIGLGMLLVTSACASDSADGKRGAQTFSQLREQELQEERRDFLAESQGRLEEVNRDIARMETRLKHEGELVDAAQRAEWSQELFELKQERANLEARVVRAESATPEEWREMRGTLGVGIDSLEAGVTRLGNALSNAFGSDESATSGTARLCKLHISDPRINVHGTGNQLLVDMTTRDEAAVEDLRRQARELPTDPDSWSRADEPQGASDEAIEVSAPVEIQDIDRGVRFVFVPRSGDLGSVRTRLEQQARRLESGRC
jgi:hypothetical protein